MDQVVQVTPIPPNGDGKKVGTPRLGNMYGLMSVLSPTTKKTGGKKNGKKYNNTTTKRIVDDEIPKTSNTTTVEGKK